jgi:riboflavin kinase / FMN adenylyltransferase
MRRWNDLTEVPRLAAETVVTFGVFDGVHRGHQRVIGRAVELARERGEEAVVVTFDPHPAAVVRPDAAPALLATVDGRVRLFEACGVDAVLVLPFTKERSRQPAEEFAKEMAGALRIATIVVGDDFRFGFKATGDVELLRRLGPELGFEVETISRDAGDPHWSSSAVRQALADGDVGTAAERLGHLFRVEGIVVRGDRRGRELGFRTANVPADPSLALPVDGVYAGYLSHPEATRLSAAISVGTKPQFGPNDRVIEAHVLGRDDLELYDVPVTIEFVRRVRGQLVFESVDGLIAEVDRDKERVREILDATGNGVADAT